MVGSVTIDIGIILAFVCVLTSIAGFFCGRSNRKSKEAKDLKDECKTQGAKEGRIEEKIDNMAATLNRLDTSVRDYRREFNGKIADVYKRIDKHIETAHGGHGNA